MRRLLLATCAGSWTLFLAGAAPAVTFDLVSDLIGFNPSRVTALSHDGSVLVGTYDPVGTVNQEAYRWSAAGGFQAIPAPGTSTSRFSTGEGVSADGSVVVGSVRTAIGNNPAYYWTAAGGMVQIGDLPGGSFLADVTGVSANGSVVVGHSSSTNAMGGDREAFRWTQAGGMVALGDLPGGTLSSRVADVSADGSVIVGTGQGAAGPEAFRWTQAGGMVGLGDLPGGPALSFAEAVSADGSVVAGTANVASGGRAFRWTAAGGMVDLGPGFPDANRISLVDMSDDGSILVGTANNPRIRPRVWVWNATLGMVDLQDNLAAQGVDFEGWLLTGVSAISGDGTALLGTASLPDGSNTRSWLIRDLVLVPEPSTALLFALGLALFGRCARSARPE
jgi:probable HAF family extracellular repeat protein